MEEKKTQEQEVKKVPPVDPLQGQKNEWFNKFTNKFFPQGDFSSEEISNLLDNLVEMKLQFQPYIDPPPFEQKESLYKQACSNDDVTVNSWREQWLRQARENAKNFDIANQTVTSEIGKGYLKPGIIAGSGPSLKKNVKELAENKGDIPLTSCAHNFAFFLDNGVKADYFVNLDAGEITLPELCHGGKRSEDYYWDATKDFTLVVAMVCHPEFLKKWKGKVLFYNTVIPDQKIMDEMNSIASCPVYFNTGGNALGACLYMSRAVLGCSPIAFVGADFSFSYAKKFHSFDSNYDSQFSGVIPVTDVYGNRVYTWPSYNNFRAWFEFQSMGGKGNNPGLWYNCTEGGTLGAHENGNIRTIQQMTLKSFLYTYNMHKLLPEIVESKLPQLLF